MRPQAEESLGPRSRGSRRDPPLEPPEGARPCPHLDFGLLASGTGREQISVALNHPVCSNWLWCSQDAGTHPSHICVCLSGAVLTPGGHLWGRKRLPRAQEGLGGTPLSYIFLCISNVSGLGGWKVLAWE